MRGVTVRGVHHHYTFADYLRVEQDSNLKHEFLDGDIYAMAGGTPLHARLTVNISSLLHAQLRGTRCHAYSSDLRVRVPATGLAAYPDVTVVCGELELDPENDHTVTNPRLVVEVLSDSTEKFDRGVKLKHYQQISSLGAVVLVSQHQPSIEVWSRRADDRWTESVNGPGTVARIDAIDCTLAVDDVYA